ncbi:MAG TPA: exosome complex RNA-binding protein Rrp4 [Candidatus Paceibacterota bacterium]|nr:exosome complex RNA-binding protein Rrp4 [Candidatus Paceibacterota bacterium]
MTKEKNEEERQIIVPGETIISGDEYLPGEGTRREGSDIVAERYGILEYSGKLVKIIPLSGVFIPRRGNVIIGQVNDISFNGWMTDINAPYASFLPVMEVPRFVDKNNLSEFLDIGDFFCAKIVAIKQKGIDLTLDDRGLGKLEDGIIIFINPNKVPRVIGKEGSMIKLIKDETNCRITIGQNGLVWIKGNTVDDELFAKKAILFVTERSFIHGLTDKVKEFLEKEKKLLEKK